MSPCVLRKNSRDRDSITSAGLKCSKNSCETSWAAKWIWSRNQFAESDCKGKSIRIEPLPSEKPARRIQDIIENAAAIERYLTQVAFEKLSATKRHVTR